MALYLVLLSYSCLLRFQGVIGKKDILPRYIIDDAVKQPIFGSYNYDPIKQAFEIDETPKTETVTAHNTQDNQINESTKESQFMRKRPILSHSRLFRKHVSITGPSIAATPTLQPSKLNNWWTRWTKSNAIQRNTTSLKNK